MSLTNLADSREHLKLMTVEYTEETEGNFIDEPVVNLFCRDSDGNRRYIDVEGYYPHFYITEQEFNRHRKDLLNETKVRSIEADERILSDQDKMNGAVDPVPEPPRTTLQNEDLVKVYTVVPGDVADLRDFFDDHWEADVFFNNRFLIDSEIYLGLSIPQGQDRVAFEDIEVLDQSETPDIKPRMLTVDIEVWSGGEFPDTQNPSKPVTAITAHDSYDDEYFCGVLHPKSVEQGLGNTWPDEPDWEFPEGAEDVDVQVYDDENFLLAGFFNFVEDKDPDLLTGWNSSRNEIGSGFDYPYLINRADNLNEWTYHKLAVGDLPPWVTNRGAPSARGREMFDMLQAYKKTQIHEKRSYSLDYIASEELDYGKEDIDGLDEGWLHNPVDFMKYNIRDTQAVFQIEESKSVLKMYDHIRSITGATYSEVADSNIGLIDMLFLRSARQQGYALPTSQKPDVQHYWGAYVFPPEAGKHKNVVYPDLSSLYPNLFRDMNASPETVIGNKADLQESRYSAEDCYTMYTDPRSESVKRSADDPKREELYVLKPEVKESFVRDVVQDLIDMKYEYKSDEYSDEAYAAVKRITNSVYGVMGDSKSYGKGFRLFDWRIAEAITLAGRDVIKHTATEFESRVNSMGYPEGKIVAGDTDSCVCEVPDADGMEETLKVAQEAAEYVDSTYDEFMLDRFGIENSNMAVEIESYAEAALFMHKKKRYAQWIRWDEGDYVDEVEVKGFELVRSDSSAVTARVQRRIIEIILKEDNPKLDVGDFLEAEWGKVMDGDVSLKDLGIPSAVNNDLMDYGWSIDEKYEQSEEEKEQYSGDHAVRFFTPQPHIRGARYSSAYIDGETVTQGSKPLMFYVDGVAPNGDLPEVYDYEDEYTLNAPDNRPDMNTREMKELGRVVDAISVDNVHSITEDVRIDFEKMGEKTIRRPVEPITDVMGWSFDDLIEGGEQTGLAAYM